MTILIKPHRNLEMLLICIKGLIGFFEDQRVEAKGERRRRETMTWSEKISVLRGIIWLMKDLAGMVLFDVLDEFFLNESSA